MSNVRPDITRNVTAAAGTEEKASKKVIARRVRGSVKWFNVKNRYGFIRRHDTEEDVFVHQSAITRSNPDNYQCSLRNGETVEFDVVQGKQGTEAVNLTGPAGTPVEGSRYAANRRCFHRGFYIRRYVPMPSGPRNSEDKDDENEGIGEGFTTCYTATQHSRRSVSNCPEDQWLRCFPRFHRAPNMTCQPSIITPTSDQQSSHQPESTSTVTPEGEPRRRSGPSYRLSRPKGRGTAPGLPSSTSISELQRTQSKETGCEASSLLQRLLSSNESLSSNIQLQLHHPQQVASVQRQDLQGEDRIRRGSEETDASVSVAKSSAAKEKDTEVQEAASEAQTE